MATKQVTLHFKPQGPVAADYLRSRGRRTLIMGPLGSAKTATSCWKIMTLMRNQAPTQVGKERHRLSRWVAIRNTYADLLGTTAKDWLDMFGHLGRWVEGAKKPPTHYLKFKMPDGTKVRAEFIFLALDREEHVRKLRGYQLTGGYLSEAKELPFGIVSMLDLRVGRYPGTTDGGPTWYGLIGDTNAPDTDHWYYQMAEEERPKGWEFFKQPGGLVRPTKDSPWQINLEAENLQNLPGAYPGAYYLEGAEGKADDWISVNLANQYGFVKSGKPCYPDYNDQVHCREFEIVPSLGIYIGMDFGLTPAAIIGQRALNGQWLLRHEVVTEDTGLQRFGADCLKPFLERHYRGVPILGIFGDPAGGQRQAGDVNERTAFQIVSASTGFDVVGAPGDNDIVMRLEAFASPMRKLIDGKPGLLIHPDCKILRKACQGGYAYHRVKVVGEERFRDTPQKNKYSHPADAGQYLILGGAGLSAVTEAPGVENKRNYAGFRKRMGYTG
jgi:hypothetical protein